MSISHLFRAEHDAGKIAFTEIHLIALVAFLIYFAVLFKLFSTKKQNLSLDKKIDFWLHAVLLSVILFLYGWYISIGQTKDALPLYHCRLSMLLLCALYLLRRFCGLKHESIVEQWTVTMAMEGAWMAIMMPSPDEFMFPHITHYTYFVGHGALLAIVFFYVKNWQTKPSFKDFLRLLRLMLIYNVFLFIFDIKMNENYGFFTDVPCFEKYFANMHLVLKFIILNIGHQLVFGVFWLANRLLWKCLHREEQLKSA